MNYLYFLLLQVAAQNCRRRKLGLISRLKDELDAARRTRKQLMDDRRKLTQECSEWALKVSDVKTMVLKGLGKNPRKYCMEIVDQCVGDYWECDVVVKKRKRHGFQVSELSPLDVITEDHLNPSMVEAKGQNYRIELSNEDRDHDEKNCQKASVNMLKEQILELESPSYIISESLE